MFAIQKYILKNKYTYRFTKNFIYILLIGQLWVNLFSYVNYYFQENTDLIELTLSKNDLESEKENDNKKEFEDKIISSFYKLSKYNSFLSVNFIHKEDLLPINLLEINTPPPEHILFIS